MKKTLVINAKFLSEELTGVGRVGVELTKRILQKNVFEVIIVSPKSNYNIILRKEFGVKKIGILKGFLWEQIELPIYMFLKYRKCLLLNFANTAPVLYKNNITYIHDLIWFTNPEWYEKKAVFYYNFLIPFVIRKSKWLLTNSDYTKNEIESLFKEAKSKLSTIYCGVSNSGEVDDVKISKFKDYYGKYFLCVSSLDPRKNLKKLIDAFLALKIPDFRLIIVGHKHKAFAEIDFDNGTKNENIIFTGYVEENELPYYYAGAYAFIYPSLKEGFGLPTLEAMSYGCPVITSNTSSLPEVCSDAAIYIDPLSLDSIKNGMIKIKNSKDIRSNLIKKGYERIEIFNWDHSANKLIEILNKLI